MLVKDFLYSKCFLCIRDILRECEKEDNWLSQDVPLNIAKSIKSNALTIINKLGMRLFTAPSNV